jgi:hypothetical protein
MNRRDFLLSVGVAVPSVLAAQQKPAPTSRPSRLTAGEKPKRLPAILNAILAHVEAIKN